MLGRPLKPMGNWWGNAPEGEVYKDCPGVFQYTQLDLGNFQEMLISNNIVKDENNRVHVPGIFIRPRMKMKSSKFI